MELPGDVRPAPTLSRRGAVVALGLAWAVFFAPHLLSSQVPYYRDHLVTNVPLRQYVRERLTAGELPQWYPYESLGVPVIGQIALGTFHPLNLLATPLPAPLGEKWALLLSYLFALAGAYRLTRQLAVSRPAAVTAAVAYGFGGFALGVSSIIAYAMSFSALPWVAWGLLRVARKGRLKDAGVLALLWPLVFLSGDALGFAMCGALGAIAALEAPSWRRAVALAGLGGVVASLVVGVELLPSTAVTVEAVRRIGVASPTMGLTWALHPLRLPELFIAGWVPDPVRYVVTGGLLGGGTALFATTLFAGGLPLALGAAGAATRRRWALGFGTLALLCAWLALGDRGGLWQVAKFVLPPLAMFRYPERFMAFFWLGLVPLVGLGADAVWQQPMRWAKRLGGAAAAVGVVAGLAALGGLAARLWAWWGVGPLPAAEHLQLIDSAWAAGAGWTAALLGLGAAVLFASVTRPPLALALPLLVFAELWHGNGAQLPLVDRALLEAPNDFARALTAASPGPGPGARVASNAPGRWPSTVTSPPEERAQWVTGMQHLLRPNVAGLFHVSALGSNLGATTRRYQSLLGPRGANTPRVGPLFNACFWVAPLGRPPRAGEQPVASAPEQGLTLLRAPCAPRAFVASAEPVADLSAAVAAVLSGRVSTRQVVWEGGPALPAAAGTVRWVRAAPEALELDVDVQAGPAALVVTDEVQPGWSATVDGAPVPIFPTLVAARGVVVPPGRHRVAFVYRTPRLGLGLASTALGLAAALALLWVGRARRPRAPG